MRKELELIEKIEHYLMGSMKKVEREAFEKEMESNAGLKEDMMIQKELMKGLEQAALRQQAQQAARKYRQGQNIMKGGIGGAAIVLVASALLYFNPMEEPKVQADAKTTEVKTEQMKDSLPVVEQPVASKKAAAELYHNVFGTEQLPKQIFKINGGRDTTLKSKSGVVLHIPKNTFANAEGQSVNGPVTIEFKEALVPKDMVLGDLVTTTNGKPLESGGMICVNAVNESGPLKLADKKTVGVAVPSKKVLKDMKVWEGVKDKNGRLNWVDPQPMGVGNNSVVAIEEKVQQEEVDWIKIDSIDGKQWRQNGNQLVAATFGGNTKQNQAAGLNYFSEDPNANYLFSMKNLGWANIDRLSNDSRSKIIDMVTKIENHRDMDVIFIRIMFEKEGIYIPGYQKKDSTFSFTHGDHEKTKLPVGAEAVIVATGYKNNKPCFATKQVVITDKQIIILKLEEAPVDKLRLKVVESMENNAAEGAP